MENRKETDVGERSPSDDLELVRNELGLGEVVIIGHSGHALMALEYAKKYFDSTPLWKGVEVNLQMVNYVWGILLSEIDITQGLNELERPVFLALGRYDFLVAPPSSWNPLKPHFKKLTLNVFEMSGHTPPYEEANLFDSKLLEWIRETG